MKTGMEGKPQPNQTQRVMTLAVIVAVGLALTLMIVAVRGVAAWQRVRAPIELWPENGAALAWAESDQRVDFQTVLALPETDWRPLDDLELDDESDRGVWLRVVLPPLKKQGSSIVALPTIEFWGVEAHWQDIEGWRSEVIGEQIPWVDRAVMSEHMALVLERPPHTPTTLYLRMMMSDYPDGWVRYWPDARSGRQYLEFSTYLYAGYFAAWAVIVGYNFLLGVLLRRRTILLYVLYVVAFGMLTYYGNGVDGMFSGSAESRGRYLQLMLLVLFQLATLLWFARDLLQISAGTRAANLMNRLLVLLGVAAIGSVLWYLDVLEAQPLWLLLSLTLIITAVALLGLAARRWWRGQVVAGWFLLAFVPVLVAFVWMWVFILIPQIPMHYTTLPFLIGSITEFVLLSVVLAFHYREIELENTRIKAEQAEKLEAEVAARTQELRELTDELSASNRFKDRIFSVLGHDLRAPVATTVQFAEALEQSSSMLPPEEIAEQAGWLRRTNEQMLTMVDDLLGWARSESGELSLTKRCLPVKDLVGPPVTMLSGVARAKGVALEVNVPDDVSVLADEKTMQTVVRNLVGNSLKFTPAGGRVEVHARRDGDRVVLAVTDTGKGMDAAQVERLRNGLGGMTTIGTAKEKGTGFGWVLCRQFTRMNDGELTIESTPGRGTTVQVSLPVESPAKVKV